MYEFFLGVLFGSGLVLAIQEIRRQYDNHVIRKEAKFAAAVNAEVERRNGWSSVQTGIGDTARHMEQQTLAMHDAKWAGDNGATITRTPDEDYW